MFCSGFSSGEFLLQYLFLQVLSIPLCPICFRLCWLKTFENSLHSWSSLQAIRPINGCIACCEVCYFNIVVKQIPFYGRPLVPVGDLCCYLQCTCATFIIQKIDDRSFFIHHRILSTRSVMISIQLYLFGLTS